MDVNSVTSMFTGEMHYCLMYHVCESGSPIILQRTGVYNYVKIVVFAGNVLLPSMKYQHARKHQQ